MSRIHQGLQRALHEAERQPESDAASIVTHAADGPGSDRGSKLVNREAVTLKDTSKLAELARNPGSSGKLALPQVSLNPTTQDQISTLVQRVFVFPNSSAPRVVAFASVDDGNGSSEICFHAGRALAKELSASVCLVDAGGDRSFLRQFAPPNGAGGGLPDALNSAEPVKRFTIRVGDENLWLLPGRSSAANSSSRLSADRMRSRLTALREAFDYVLVDAPPVISAATAVLLGQIADGMILVIEANSTRRHNARTAKESLHAANVKLLGAILNNHTLPGTVSRTRKS
jgi:Mrp family chromosome partitioning ATPase